jgi:precorrin-3B methylase
MDKGKGKLFVVGVGPGRHEHMTYRAMQVIKESEAIIGYDTYVSLVEDLITGKEVYRYAMTQEVDRANQAIHFAEEGKIVSLVSSGDPGIYGMAGLIYEILVDKGWSQDIALTTLDKMLDHQHMLGMITTVIVGNSSTFIHDGMMINPRGYSSKYELLKGVSATV